MVTSVALAMVIAFEPHELDVMNRRPRAVNRPILTAFGIWRVLSIGVALLVLRLSAFFWIWRQALDSRSLLPGRRH
jgi:magnesium-transporting ATPase (P-type)